MAVTAGQIAVTSAAPGTLVVPVGNATANESRGGYQMPNRDIFLSNGSGATVFLGPTGVTTTTGCPLAASTTLRISIHIDEALYGIVASTGTTVSFLASGS